MPHRYIIAVIAIFLILVLGMVTPDILQFFSQQHQLEALQKNEAQSAVSITISNQNGTIIVTNLPCTNGTNATISLSLTNTTKLAFTTVMVLAQPQTPVPSTNLTASFPAPSTPFSTSTPFEPYARLVTLLLSIVSVSGLFFAYFVRKSLRETEEDLEKRFERKMEAWSTAQNTIVEKVKADAAQISATRGEVDKLAGEFREALHAASETRPPSDQRSAGTNDVNQAVNALEAMAEPAPQAQPPPPVQQPPEQQSPPLN